MAVNHKVGGSRPPSSENLSLFLIEIFLMTTTVVVSLLSISWDIFFTYCTSTKLTIIRLHENGIDEPEIM
jgi:hypothetical protein